MQENNLRKSIPKPYNFQDDPILDNTVAVSKVKLNGDSVDAWTQFLTNEFYELDKNKGAVLNIVKEDYKIVAIQERQTTILNMDERSFVTPDDEGTAIQINQGNGTSITGHQKISDFGTSQRRAIIKTDLGFVFFDENKFEFVKVKEGLFLKNNLLLSVRDLFKSNKIIDVEGYYDSEYKETNIRFRTSTGFNFVISYNELLNVFNGKIDFDNDLYMRFQEKIITPYFDSKKLGELNSGNELEFFDVNKKSYEDFYEEPYEVALKIVQDEQKTIQTP